MSNYEDFRAALSQLSQDPNKDTQLFARLFVAYEEHISVKKVTADLEKMMKGVQIKDEPQSDEQTEDQQPQTPHDAKQSPKTAGVNFHKQSGKYQAQRWDKKKQKKVYLGHYDTELEAIQAVAAYDTDGTVASPDIKLKNEKNFTSKYKGVGKHECGRYVARREGKVKGKTHIGLFVTEEEAAKAVKATGSFKQFYDDKYPDL